MEYIYNQHDIDLFFDRFKQLPEYYELAEVHQLINNQDAIAKFKVKYNYKYLKFIIMTSIVVVVLSSLIIWFSVNNRNNDPNQVKTNMAITKNDTVTDKNFTNSNREKTNLEGLNEKTANQTQNANLNKTDQSTANEKEPVGFTFPGILKDLLQKDDLKGKNDSISTNNLNVSNLDQNKKKEENCNWPDDIIINKNALFVELTEKELKKIGVIKIGNSIFYHNIWAYNDHFSSKIEDSNFPENEKITTRNYFHRHFSTSLNFIQGLGGRGGRDDFFSMMDTLVPIIISRTSCSGGACPGTIWWFNPHKTLFESFPGRYKYLEAVYNNLRCLKNKYPNKSFTNYLSPKGNVSFEPIHALELNKENLKLIGVNIIDTCIIIKSGEYRSSDCFKRVNEKDFHEKLYNNKDIIEIPYESLPILRTDTIGRVLQTKNVSIGPHVQSMDLLIPVKIDIDKLFNLKGYKPYILWFYPSDKFIKALPVEIRNQLKLERDAIVKGNKTATGSCTYFEVCKSTLKVDELKVYPNPATQSVTVSFILPEMIEGEITLTNINGTKNRSLVSYRSFLPGKNSYKIDLTDLMPGIYIISITTDQGFKTQRIIKSQ